VYIPHTDSTKAFSFLNLAVEGCSFAGVFSSPIYVFLLAHLDALEHFTQTIHAQQLSILK